MKNKIYLFNTSSKPEKKKDCKYGLQKANCTDILVLIQHTEPQPGFGKCGLRGYSLFQYLEK